MQFDIRRGEIINEGIKITFQVFSGAEYMQ